MIQLIKEGSHVFIILVHINVKPEQTDAFIDLIRANHLGSIQEPGCIRFDVARSTEDPNRFVLWEWYEDEDAAQAHRETPHYLAFAAKGKPMMAEERVRTVYEGLFPQTGARPG